MTDPLPLADALKDNCALFLDFDGTLASFRDDPAEVHLEPNQQDILKTLYERLEGRLAIVSGRALDDLSSRIGLAQVSLAGSHGIERRHGRQRIGPSVSRRAKAAHDELSDYAKRHGLILERKPFGVALHFRGATKGKGDGETLMSGIAEAHGMDIQYGNEVIELREPGADKGDAVEFFMELEPFRGVQPLVVGDDLTDEHAFEAAQALGGLGIIVGDRKPTAASHRLADVAAVWKWLERAACKT